MKTKPTTTLYSLPKPVKSTTTNLKLLQSWGEKTAAVAEEEMKTILIGLKKPRPLRRWRMRSSVENWNCTFWKITTPAQSCQDQVQAPAFQFPREEQASTQRYRHKYFANTAKGQLKITKIGLQIQYPLSSHPCSLQILHFTAVCQLLKASRVLPCGRPSQQTGMILMQNHGAWWPATYQMLPRTVFTHLFVHHSCSSHLCCSQLDSNASESS